MNPQTRRKRRTSKSSKRVPVYSSPQYLRGSLFLRQTQLNLEGGQPRGPLLLDTHLAYAQDISTVYELGSADSRSVYLRIGPAAGQMHVGQMCGPVGSLPFEPLAAVAPVSAELRVLGERTLPSFSLLGCTVTTLGGAVISDEAFVMALVGFDYSSISPKAG